MKTRPKHRPSQPAPTEHTGYGLERLVFFSDAVIAIAITLLSIDLKLPETGQLLTNGDLQVALVSLAPRFTAFLISFLVIGVYWVSHHRYLGFIVRYDQVLIVLNFLFLFFIVLMPFMAGILGEYADLPLGIGLYSAAIACTGYSLGAMWNYATQNNRLVDPHVDRSFIQTVANSGDLVSITSSRLRSCPLETQKIQTWTPGQVETLPGSGVQTPLLQYTESASSSYCNQNPIRTYTSYVKLSHS
jgi:uncharacterized membrane protein